MNDTQNKMDRVNIDKWWRMQNQHDPHSSVLFIVDYAPRLVQDRTPDNVMMRMKREERNQSSEDVHSRPLREMREEWNKMVRKGYVYNGD